MFTHGLTVFSPSLIYNKLHQNCDIKVVYLNFPISNVRDIPMVLGVLSWMVLPYALSAQGNTRASVQAPRGRGRGRGIYVMIYLINSKHKT